MEHQHIKVAIIGAGIAGLLTARVLEDLNFQGSLFEAGKTVRGVGAEIGLASNAMRALEDLGVANKIRELGNTVDEFRICDPSGKRLFEIDTKRIEGTYQAESYAIHRAELHHLLLKGLKITRVYLSKRVVRLEVKESGVVLFFEDSTEMQFDYVIAADGIHSVIRKQLIPNSDERYAGYWCWRCVAEVPKEYRLQGKAIWGKKGRFGMKLMSRNRVYWFACINTPLDGEIPKFTLSDLKKYFNEYVDVPELLKYSQQANVLSDGVYDIAPLQQFAFDRVLLIGDAAHATTPNMGQGAGMAVEDVAVLKTELEHNDIASGFEHFNRKRVQRTAYIIKNSRNAGRVAQLDHRLGIAIRNWAFRNLPSELMQAPIRRLYDEDYRRV